MSTIMINDATQQLDQLLQFICEDLQLPGGKYKDAVDRYEAVGRWLSDPTSPVAAFDPHIYPQGSMLLGTTNRPIGRDEYDLDFVCELRKGYGLTSEQAYNLIKQRLEQNATYKKMLEPKNRCLRLNYAGDFHMDILPAIPDVRRGGTCVLVPDRKLRDWSPSNPKGYAAWFSGRESDAKILSRDITPMPKPVSTSDKSHLAHAVQLTKRNRDKAFYNKDNERPASIIITTLFGHAYTYTPSLFESFATTLERIVAGLSDKRVPRVQNPTNPDENFADKWEQDPMLYIQFRTWMCAFRDRVRGLRLKHGTDLTNELNSLFGEDVVARAYNRQAELMAREKSKTLGYKSGLATLATGSAASAKIPRNEFYGD